MTEKAAMCPEAALGFRAGKEQAARRILDDVRLAFSSELGMRWPTNSTSKLTVISVEPTSRRLPIVLVALLSPLLLPSPRVVSCTFMALVPNHKPNFLRH